MGRVICLLAVLSVNALATNKGVKGVEVIVKKYPTGTASMTRTDASGLFHVPALDPGEYQIRVVRAALAETGPVRPMNLTVIIKSTFNIKNKGRDATLSSGRRWDFAGGARSADAVLFEEMVTLTDGGDLSGILVADDLTVAPAAVGFTGVESGSANTRFLQVSNNGDSAMAYEAAFAADPKSPPWTMRLEGQTGMLSPGAGTEVSATPLIGPSAPGTYTGRIVITTDRAGEIERRSVPVRLTVVARAGSTPPVFADRQQKVAFAIDRRRFEEQRFRLTNPTPTPRRFNVVPGAAGGPFKVTASPAEFTLAPGGSQDVTLFAERERGDAGDHSEPVCVTVRGADGSTMELCELPIDACYLTLIEGEDTPLKPRACSKPKGAELGVTDPKQPVCQAKRLVPVITQFDPRDGSGRLAVFDDCGLPRADYTGEIQFVDDTGASVAREPVSALGKAITKSGVGGLGAVVSDQAAELAFRCNKCGFNIKEHKPLAVIKSRNPLTGEVLTGSSTFAPAAPAALGNLVEWTRAFVSATQRDDLAVAPGERLIVDGPPLVEIRDDLDSKPFTPTAEGFVTPMDLAPGDRLIRAETAAGTVFIPMLVVPARPVILGVANADGQANEDTRPAKPGDSITVLAAGLGASTEGVTVRIGANSATVRGVEAVGDAPGTFRIAVEVPAMLNEVDGVAPETRKAIHGGNHTLPVSVGVGGANSPPVGAFFDPNAGPMIEVRFSTSPVPLGYVVDGNAMQGYSGVLYYAGGASVSIDVPNVVQPAGVNTRYRFNSWAHGGSATQTLTVPSANSSYQALFEAEYKLDLGTFGTPAPTVTASPAADPDGYYRAGTVVTIQASCPNGYQPAGLLFVRDGSLTPLVDVFVGDSPYSLNMQAPFAASVGCLAAIDVRTNPAAVGLGFTIDGNPYKNSTTYVSGLSSATLATTSPQTTGNTQYVFVNWTPGPAALSQTVPNSSPATYTANFRANAYQVTVTGCGATVGPVAGLPAGFFPAGATVTINLPAGQQGQSATVTIGNQSTTYTTFPVRFPLTGPANVIVTCVTNPACPPAPTDVASHYPLESASAINDVSGNGRNGSIVTPIWINTPNPYVSGGTLTALTGKTGNGVTFTRQSGGVGALPSGNYTVPAIELPVVPSLDPSRGDLSLTTYVRFAAADVGFPQVVWGQSWLVTGNVDSAFRFGINSTPGTNLGRTEFTIEQVNVPSPQTIDPATGLPAGSKLRVPFDGNWHCVGFSLRLRSDGFLEITFTVDGVADGPYRYSQKVNPAPYLFVNVPTLTPNTAVPRTYIGWAGYDTSTQDLRFSGSLDEFKLFARALTGAELQTLCGNCPGSGTPIPVTVNSNPPNIGATVGVASSGTSSNLYLTTLPAGSNQTVTASSPVIFSNTQYTLQNWTPAGPNVTLPASGSATYTANYLVTGYVVTVNTTGGCSLNPAPPSPWIVAPGASISFGVSVPTGSVVSGVSAQTGGAAGLPLTGPAYSYTVTGPTTIGVACGPASTFPVTVNTSPAGVGLTVQADGNNVVNSGSFNWTGTHSLNVISQTQTLNNSQYRYNRWTANPPGGSIAAAPTAAVSVTPTAATTYTAVFDASHLVTINQPTGCTINIVSTQPAVNGYYPQFTQLRITVTANSGYTAPTSVTITPQGLAPFNLSLPVTNLLVGSPLAISALCAAGNVDLNLNSNPPGLLVRIGASGNFQAGPITQKVPPNQAQTIAAQTPQVNGGAGYVFSQWSNGAATPVTSITPTDNTSVTAVFSVACYLLTVTSSGPGAVTLSPANGNGGAGLPENCYAPGTAVTLTAAPGAGSLFAGWSGAASGTAATTTVTMNGPRSVTATFAGNAVLDVVNATRTNAPGTVTLTFRVPNTGSAAATNVNATIAVSGVSLAINNPAIALGTVAAGTSQPLSWTLQGPPGSNQTGAVFNAQVILSYTSPDGSTRQVRHTWSSPGGTAMNQLN